MSDLTDALQRIMNWLEKHQPKYAASFLPGLTSDEIKTAEVELGFKLPEEIYELYQWRNGTTQDYEALFFTPMQYLPLAEAISSSQGVNENNSAMLEEGLFQQEEAWYEKSPLFVFLQSNCDYCGIPLNIDFQAKAPVVSIAAEGDRDIFYTNLPAMMLTLAECYETGAYYLRTDGYLCEDECKAAQILRKHNQEMGEEAISKRLFASS